MPDLSGLGKLLILVGAVLAGLGLFLAVLPKVPGAGDWFGWLGRLPGDLYVKRENFTFYFPLATSLVVSIVLSVLFYLLSRR